MKGDRPWPLYVVSHAALWHGPPYHPGVTVPINAGRNALGLEQLMIMESVARPTVAAQAMTITPASLQLEGRVITHIAPEGASPVTDAQVLQVKLCEYLGEGLDDACIPLVCACTSSLKHGLSKVPALTQLSCVPTQRQ